MKRNIQKAVKSKKERKGVLPFPNCQPFEAHSSELKPDPVGNLGQASVLGIAHSILFFGVNKDPFDGRLTSLVQL